MSSIKKALPSFPHFKKLELEDKEQIEKIAKKFPPYSDYNFVSLWSYNTEDDIIVSVLNDNLIIRFRDYVTNEPFYSFLGNKNTVETAQVLLKYARKEKILDSLKLIPEDNLMGNKNIFDLFTVIEDRDNFDYIFSTENVSGLKGAKYGKKRNKVSKFLREYPKSKVTIIDLTNTKNHQLILDTFELWKQKKNRSDEDTIHELTAIKRLLQDARYFNFLCVGIYCDFKLKGFSITEVLYDKYAIFHFVKADPTHTGIFEYIYSKTAKELTNRGCIFMSREQDLGISNLRNAKSSWYPIKFLKKYIITPK